MKSWLCLYCLCVCELAPQLYVPNVYRARTTGVALCGGRRRLRRRIHCETWMDL
jgi:hypothetical protein